MYIHISFLLWRLGLFKWTVPYGGRAAASPMPRGADEYEDCPLVVHVGPWGPRVRVPRSGSQVPASPRSGSRVPGAGPQVPGPSVPRIQVPGPGSWACAK